MRDTDLTGKNSLSSRGRVHDIIIFLLSVLIVIFELPYLTKAVPNIIALGLMLLVGIMCIPFILKMGPSRQLAVLAFAVYFAVIILYCVARISSVTVESHYTLLRFYFFGIIMMAIQDAINIRQKKYLTAVIIVSVLYDIISNVVLYIRYGAVLYVHIFQMESFNTNAVNTQFVTSLLFFSGALFVYFLHRCKYRLFALALSFTGILFAVLITQRAMIAIFALIMYGLLLLFNTQRRRERLIFGVIAVILVFVVLVNIETILQWFSQVVGSVRLQDRINQLYRFFASGDIGEAGGSLTARAELIQTSLKTFTSSARHFLLGAGAHTVNNRIIGNHSYIADELGRYGIFFGSLSFFVFFDFLNLGMKKQANVQKGTVLYWQMNVILFICLLRSLVGRVNEVTSGVQLFLFVPFVFQKIIYDQQYASGAPSKLSDTDQETGNRKGRDLV